MELPKLIAAPMAGGVTTSESIISATAGGAFAFASGGYLTAEQLNAQLVPVRAAGINFGVNLFVPPQEEQTEERAAQIASYKEKLLPFAERFGISSKELAATPSLEARRDYFDAKIDLLIANPAPVVSFTFGLPKAKVIDLLRRAGSSLIASVTSPEEATLAEEAGFNALVLQHGNAGGHSAAFLPANLAAAGREPRVGMQELISATKAVTRLPIIAAGGIGTSRDLKQTLTAGASAAMLGTAFLLAPESGTKPAHRLALTNGDYPTTELTRAFTGKWARALANSFVRDFTSLAPAAYPELHFLTRQLRAKAAELGDSNGLNLWAGTAWGDTREASAEQIARDLLATL